MGALRVDLSGLSERFSALRLKGKRPRISWELKKAVLEALGSGASVQQVAAACGLNPVQVYHWRASLRKESPKASTSLRKVNVLPPAGPLKITLPGGAVVEADEAHIDLAVKLLRGLA